MTSLLTYIHVFIDIDTNSPKGSWSIELNTPLLWSSTVPFSPEQHSLHLH